MDGIETIGLDECIKRATEALGYQPWSRRTLQNKISKGEFERFGSYHHPMVDWNEVRRSLHWKRKVS